MTFAALMLGVSVAAAQDAQPAATLNLARQRPACCEQPTATNLRFTSEHSISASYCEGGCRLYVIDWDGSTLKISSETAVDSNTAELSGLEPMRSSDGSRLLEVHRERKSHGFFDKIRTIVTLGMSGEEWDNHETFRVISTATGKTCFECSRMFQKANDLVLRNDAALSPSGQLLAIASKNGVSLFHISEPIARPASPLSTPKS